MPNIATVLKEEISRLARKEVRHEIAGLQKASAQYRRDVAQLKRHVLELQRQVALIERKVLAEPVAKPVTAKSARMRFTAKGLRAQRKRLGLTAAEYAALVDVTPKSIYNWERETARPRTEQLAALAALRGIGKKEAKARLRQLAKQGKTH
jgi:DNA-binding transcriptional regulator YiaG